MHRAKFVYVCVIALSMVPYTSYSLINSCSHDAGFIVSGTGSLEFDGGVLDGISLELSGGSISGDSSTSCDHVSIVVNHHNKYVFNGNVVFNTGEITLGDNDNLLITGGLVTSAIIAEGGMLSPSSIEGYGQCTQAIYVADNSQLTLRWHVPLTVNIVTNGSDSILNLEHDLVFSSGHGITGSVASVYCNNNRLSFGGTVSAPVTISESQSWFDARVVLTGNVALADNTIITFSNRDGDDHSGYVYGDGYTLTLGDNAQLNGQLLTHNCSVVLENIVLHDVVYDSLHSGLGWVFKNTTFDSGLLGTSLTVVRGETTTQALNIFGDPEGFVDGGNNGSVAWQNVYMIFNTEQRFGADWSFASTGHIQGNGFSADLEHAQWELTAPLYLSNVSLLNVADTSFKNNVVATALESALRLQEVIWTDVEGQSLKILPSGDAVYAELLLSLSEAAGAICDTSVVWNDASIELLSNISLGVSGQSTRPAWTFNNCSFNGNGATLNLNFGSLRVDTGVLALRNIVLKDVSSESFIDGAADAVVELSNVVVHLAQDADFSALDLTFRITGPVTFIVGDHTFVASAGSTIDKVSVYYDTLSSFDGVNIQGFTLLNGARCLFVSADASGLITIDQSGTVYLSRNEYLGVATSELAGRTIMLDAQGTVLYDGQGRSLVFPTSSDAVITIAADSVLKTTNMVFDGLLPSHITGDGSLYFGDQTVIRLLQDWYLDRAFLFGTTTGNSSEEMMIDLNNFTINMHDENAYLALRGGSGRVLRICNGRLAGLSETKLRALQAGGTIIFENIEIVLNATVTTDGQSVPSDYTFASGGVLVFQGACGITGLSGVAFKNQSNGIVTIATDSTLMIADGVSYVHNNNGANIVMTDSSSCIHILGGSFVSQNTNAIPLELADGVIIVDGAATFDCGSYGITIDDSATVHIRPSATIRVAGPGELVF